MAKIEAKTLKGFRDFLPEKQIPRNSFIEEIKKVYETFGFSPLETPALEYAKVLTGKYGDEGEKLMYRFKDRGDRDVALRYDLTIPLARVIAEYPEIKKPFKRYQISPVWRAENTQKGRFREFYQCDADIVGTESLVADAEILALSAEALKSLDVKDFVIRTNSRKILNAFYNAVGIKEKDIPAVLRIVDKIEKIGRDGVLKELGSLELSKEIISKVCDFAETKINDLKKVEEYFKKFPEIEGPLTELVLIVEKAKLFTDFSCQIDFSIARGLDYYTGMIFETNLNALPSFGSVLSGGRYDKLIGMFGKDEIPAVGASIGLDRLYGALEELKLIKTQKNIADVCVLNIDENLFGQYVEITKELRSVGIKTFFFFETADIKKQLSYAGNEGIQYAVIFGANEAKSDYVLIKDLNSGSQEKINKSEIVSFLSGKINK